MAFGTRLCLNTSDPSPKARRRWLKTAGLLVAGASVAATVVLGSAPSVFAAEAHEPLELWYTDPASVGGGNQNDIWQKRTLPIGNGDMGANVYGEVATEHLTFNEKTLWTGGPSKSRPNYNGGNNADKGKHGETLKKIQDLFAKGKNKEASDLCNQLIGDKDGYGAYQAWGDIMIAYTDLANKQASNYERSLDIADSLAEVDFDVDGTHYGREFLASHPDKVVAGKLTAKGTGKLNLKLTFPSKQGGTTRAENDSLILEGNVSDNGLRYASVLKVVAKGGTVTAKGDSLEVKNASELTFYVAAATDYKNVYPGYRTGETSEALLARVKDTAAKAASKGYDKVRADHVKDVSALLDRVDIDLGNADKVSDKATDKLLTAYNNGTATQDERRQLEELLYQYGRYLTISSSREDSQLPSNLQGVWNNSNSPQWSSDYHLNVNLQMNYWPTYSTNLAECANPLVNYVDSLREPGRVTADVYAGIKTPKGDTKGNGFMAHTQNTPFGWTCPGWSFDWGWSPAAVPWILQNTYDYYRYTGDVDYLKKEIYPALREEAVMYSQLLVKDANGKYVTSPTYSPEHGPRTQGNTYEQALIWQLFHDAIEAGKVVGEDADVLADWQDKFDNLRTPIEVGADGQIKEWYIEDHYNQDSTGKNLGEGFNHRHISHMLGLFPGTLISPDTPEWFAAARVSMNKRTDSSTGWGMGQRINTWAHLRDGDRAYKLVGDLFRSGIYPNLWDTHPPFQIDGNFGATSGMTEMLLQSSNGCIDLLPALPAAWDHGSAEGLVARGNFEVSMDWAHNALTGATLKSRNGGTATLRIDSAELASVTDASGANVAVKHAKDGKVSFETKKGQTYTLHMVSVNQSLAAPEGLIAALTESAGADVSWKPVAVEGKQVTYELFRQNGGSTWQKVADGLASPKYVDASVSGDNADYSYRVRAVVDGKPGVMSAPVRLVDLRHVPINELIDDTDPLVHYTGSWGDWKSKEGNFNDTIKFINDPTGSETASLTFAGTGVEAYTCLNHDRGKYEVSIDGKVVKEVDTYNAQTKRQAKIFAVDDLPYGVHTLTLRPTNTKCEASSDTKVELDAFKVLDNGKRTYTVTFDSNGGDQGTFTASVTGGEAVGKPEDPTRSGWTFEGWFDSASGKLYDFAAPVKGNLTLKAKWSTEAGVITPAKPNKPEPNKPEPSKPEPSKPDKGTEGTLAQTGDPSLMIAGMGAVSGIAALAAARRRRK